MTDSPEYIVWKSVVARCTDKNHPGYQRYGSRGIRICRRWRDSFESFYADMGPRPSMAHTIDRIDGAKGYKPGNCRWADPKTQQRNRRSNKVIEFQGRRMCISAWAEEVGLSNFCLWRRLAVGWPIHLALTTPSGALPSSQSPVVGRVPRRFRIRDSAHHAVQAAVKSGRLKRPPHCQHPNCTAQRVEAHHHRGYEPEYWIDVVWLCKVHHELAEKSVA